MFIELITTAGYKILVRHDSIIVIADEPTGTKVFVAGNAFTVMESAEEVKAKLPNIQSGYPSIIQRPVEGKAASLPINTKVERVKGKGK